MKVKTVVGIPGLWPTRGDLLREFIPLGDEATPRYMLLGPLMRDTKTNETLLVEEYAKDPALRDAFAASNQNLEARLLDRIDEHTRTLYLVDEDGGTVESAERMHRFACAILAAGGLAIKVESAGRALPADIWQELDPRNPYHLCEAFVQLVGGDEYYYSCGMHNLGMPDVMLRGDVDPKTAGNTIFQFMAYMIVENPTLKDGQTFGIARAAPVFRMRKTTCELFALDHLFHNPFGLWELVPA